jgi:4-amino-4-deoxy-L-arabinose transferase-like glycosyltransferase
VSRSEAAEARHGISAWLADARIAAALLALLSVFILFHDLGGAALFDPDEGRNAEIAREVLVTGDWVTPYYNFLPRLEKPMLFYAATALSYKVFGVSEAAARFPSASAALGVLLLTFFFVRGVYGERQALWSALVLVTCVQFFAFSRIVILDMMLAFFTTVALLAYYRASGAAAPAEKRRLYFTMYAAAAGATLVKGPIGFVFPGMIIVAYIAARGKWSSLRKMDLGWGVLIFLVIAAPWYICAELRRPGYLAYFLGEEHFTRYLTPHFHRTKPWHYFFGVVGIGFLPWTFLLPAIAARLRRNLDDISLYALLWAAVPFMFFSFSSSKMSEYLLPIYPALAILAGATLGGAAEGGRLRLMSLGWLLLALGFLSLVLVLTLPGLASPKATEALKDMALGDSAAAAAVTALVLLGTAWVTWRAARDRLLPLYCLAFPVIFFIAHRAIEPLSLARSYKELGVRAAALSASEDPAVLVIYDSYLPSLPFYLRIRAPMWIVAQPSDDEVLGSFYVAAKKPAPAPGYGQALLSYEEFDREWARRKLLVFVKEKRLFELHGAKVLLEPRGVALVTNR